MSLRTRAGYLFSTLFGFCSFYCCIVVLKVDRVLSNHLHISFSKVES